MKRDAGNTIHVSNCIKLIIFEKNEITYYTYPVFLFVCIKLVYRVDAARLEHFAFVLENALVRRVEDRPVLQM